MRFVLVKDASHMTYYGNVPNAPLTTDETVDVFPLELEDWPLLEKDFVNPINDECGVLLDRGDIDYFDVNKCALLKDWLERRLERLCSERLRTIYTVLLEYAATAIALGTGIVVEL